MAPTATSSSSPADAGADGRDPHASYRSIDFLLRGSSVHTNAHLREFARLFEHNLLDKLQRDDNYASWSNTKGRTLRKEITESMAAIGRVRRELRKGVKCAERERLCVFDLCSGKGLLSACAGYAFGNDDGVDSVRVHMVDNDLRMKLDHLKSETERVTFHAMDMYSSDLDALVARECAAPNTRVVVVGIHLCGELSRRAIELFVGHKCDVLVLAPCCLVRERKRGKRRFGKFGYGLSAAAKRLGTCSSDLWCKLLYDTLPSHVDDDFVRVYKTYDRDEDMLTEKSAFITARRGEGARCDACDDA